MHWLTELQGTIIQGALQGAAKGSLVGAAASIASGAAVVASAPAWVPFVGGASVVAMGTVAAWSAVGSGLGALTGGAYSCHKLKRQARAFEEQFPPSKKSKSS